MIGTSMYRPVIVSLCLALLVCAGAAQASLLNVNIIPPTIDYGSDGQTVFDAATMQFSVDASTLAITFADSNFAFIDAPRGLHIRLLVSSEGIASSNGNPDDLVVEGSIDADGDGVADYSGVLLTGRIKAFGFEYTGTTVNSFDYIFGTTGGSMASLFAGGDIGLTHTSENSTFTGSFTTSFIGQAKGVIGMVPLASLGDRVWHDLNNNGLQDAGEPGVAGVPVSLYDCAGTLVAQTTTDGAGNYKFEQLNPGSYYVVFDKPAGYVFAATDAGEDDQDSDADATTGRTACVVLNPLENNTTVDAGLCICSPPSLLGHGCTGTIGFWANKNGQALIRLLGAASPTLAGTSTDLGNWLAGTFPNMYGSGAGLNNFSGKTTDYIAQRFISLKNVKGQKLDAQVLAVCLATYTTTTSLNSMQPGQSFAMQHGFVLTSMMDPANLARAQWNVGNNNEAFGVSAGFQDSPMNLLLQANAYAVNGVLWANGLTIGGVSYSTTALRNQANEVFSAINEAGDIP